MRSCFCARLLGLIALCSLTGCFPYHYTTRPGLSGVVVSEFTREPLPDAGISFLRDTNTVAISANDGTFAVVPRRKWGVWIIPQDVFPAHYTVAIGHVGYETNFTTFVFSMAATGNAATTNLGIISLKRLPH